MSRAEFSKQTKREAWDRSGGICEATGSWWGLPEGVRCTNRVAEYDHIILDANSHDNSLANCAAVCTPCHRYKTTTRDTPTAAKTLRQQDKNRGIRGPKFRWWNPAKSVRREALRGIMRARCHVCRFWIPEKQKTEGVLYGQCRRHAPLVVPVRRHRPWADPTTRNVWPYTSENEWCGEFGSKETPDAHP